MVGAATRSAAAAAVQAACMNLPGYVLLRQCETFRAAGKYHSKDGKAVGGGCSMRHGQR